MFLSYGMLYPPTDIYYWHSLPVHRDLTYLSFLVNIKTGYALFTIARTWKQPRCPSADERIRKLWYIYTKQFSSVAQSCPTLCNPMNHSTPGLPVHHQLPEFTQTHVHRVSDAIQPSHSLLSPSPPVPNPSQHQSLFQWVNSSHEVAKVLEFQL